MIPPTSIDGTDIVGATIDGTDVTEITVDGDTVFTAAAQLPTTNLIHRYDFSAASTTTTFVEDLAGSDDLTTGSFSGFRTVNGLQVGDFDNDAISGSWSSTPSEPFSYVSVVRLDVKRGSSIMIDGFNEFVHPAWYRDEVAGWNIYQGNSINYSATPDPLNTNYVTAIFDGTDEFFVNGNSVDSGDAGNIRPTGVTMGDDHVGRGDYMDGIIGEVLVYDSDLSTNPTRAAVEQYIKDKWGL